MRVRDFVVVATAAVLLAVAGDSSAQIVRQMTVIVVKFQNDPSEPISIAEVRASVAPTAGGGQQTFGDFLPFATNGLMTLDVRVIPRYITIPYDKRPAPGGCTMPGPKEGTINGQSWLGPAITAAQAAGHTIVGQAWAYVPQMFGQCSHVDTFGVAVHGGIQLGGHFQHYYAWRALALPLSVAWTCRGGDGTTYVTISDNCLQPNGQRNVKTIDGQGSGVFSLFARQRIGTMPADRLRTITSVSSPQTFTLTPLEVAPPAGGVQGVILPSIGMTLEYHVASPFQGGWDAGCIAAYKQNSNSILDFTPDGNWGGALCANQSYVHQTGLRIRTGAATSTGIAVTIDQTTPPPVLTIPPASPNCTIGPSVSDGTAVWSIQAGSYSPLRNGALIPGGHVVWQYLWAEGVIYMMGSDRLWSQWTGSRFTTVGAQPPCGAGAKPAG